jgi:hypothetical protein
MLVIWLGALCVLSGLLFIATQPIWRGRFSEARRLRRRKSSAVPRDAATKPAEPMTPEPPRPGAGSASAEVREQQWRKLIDEYAATKPAEPMTLEPPRPGAGFGLKANWPGLVLIILGGILLLAWAGLWPQ